MSRCQRWAPFTSETQVYLDWLMGRYGEELANGIAVVLAREVVDQGRVAGKQKIAELEQEIEGLREKHVSRVDKLKARISQLEQEKEQAQRSPIETQNIRQVEKYAIDAALAATDAKKWIEELEQELACSQQNGAVCQEKLSQTSSRIQKLERQVEVQRQRLAQSNQQPEVSSQAQHVAELEQELAKYRQVVDLSDRRRLQQQLYDIGEQIGYRQFIPADHLLAVGHGVEYWRAFAENATHEELAQAVVRVKHYAENLLWLDNQDELKRAKQRIRELERQVKANGT
jgi:hypothetical protein